MEIDRRSFLATLGGVAAVETLPSETLADALEHHMMDEIDRLGAQNNQLAVRRGAGSIFASRGEPEEPGGRPVPRPLAAMPERPTLVDFFKLRFAPATHVLQSATDALKKGEPEERVLACLLHDVVLNLIKVDHGWWGAQIFEPYVPERTTFAIRHHQTLRFFPDEEAGYEYPEMYYRTFGIDYEPPEYIQKTYEMVRNHKYYMDSRLVTVNDLYSFDSTSVVTLDPFMEIIGRHFKQPKEGLGYDGSPVAHMWRTMINPDAPL